MVEGHIEKFIYSLPDTFSFILLFSVCNTIIEIIQSHLFELLQQTSSTKREMCSFLDVKFSFLIGQVMVIFFYDQL